MVGGVRRGTRRVAEGCGCGFLGLQRLGILPGGGLELLSCVTGRKMRRMDLEFLASRGWSVKRVEEWWVLIPWLAAITI